MTQGNGAITYTTSTGSPLTASQVAAFQIASGQQPNTGAPPAPPLIQPTPEVSGGSPPSILATNTPGVFFYMGTNGQPIYTDENGNPLTPAQVAAIGGAGPATGSPPVDQSAPASSSSWTTIAILLAVAYGAAKL